MKSFRHFLLESTTVYHGDNYATKKIDIKLMNNGNNQEGAGIYFGTLKIAQVFGKNIVKAEINPKRFLNTLSEIGKGLGSSGVLKMMKALFKLDPETFFYLITDYGVEISEQKDITNNHLVTLTKLISKEQFKNFTVDMSERFGVEKFVPLFNKLFPKIDGFFNKQLKFYIVINPLVKVTPL